MKRIEHPCRDRQQDLSLLAAGALDDAEKRELENHLATCAACQNYFNKLKTAIAPLTDWEQKLSSIEATPEMQARWTRAIKNSDRSSTSSHASPKNLWQLIWRELIRPSRYAWGGMAALWLIILAVNGRLSESQSVASGTQAASSQAMIQAWQDQNRIMAELTQPNLPVPDAPQLLPRPHSERHRTWGII